MPDPSSSRFENMGRRVDEHLGGFGDRVEEEVRRVISFLNDRVVPEVRQNSSIALRAAAEQLNRLADTLENRSHPPTPHESRPSDQQ